MSDEMPYMTVGELAEVLRISTRTAYYLCARGEVPAVRIGGQWRISRAELEARLTAEASPK
jgi:excisionase family DNA binding protein